MLILIARNYKPTLIRRQFHVSENISRREARQVKPKVIKYTFYLITVYNPVMKNLEKVLNDNLHILYADPDMKKVFPEGTISVTYRRRKCLEELISPSLHPGTATELQSLHLGLVSVMRLDVTKVRIVWCSKMNSLVMLHVRYIKVRGNLTSKSDNVIHLKSLKKCNRQYAGSAFESNFMPMCGPGLEFAKVISILAKSGVKWPSIS